MSVTLIIAEKPSVGRDIARVVGARTRRDGYLEGPRFRVSWCIGHLAELCEPHEYDPAWKRWSADLLPILPDRFKVRPSKSGAKQLAVLRGLLRSGDVATVINACDAGREGELIFRYVYELTRCSKPVKRLWISSLTSQAIERGMSRLRPGDQLDPLADAARCRSEADWLVGMNATRALTALGRKSGGKALMSVGRVQTPTLALIVAREIAIERFVSEPYWQVRATFARLVPVAGGPDSGPGEGDEATTYEGLWHRPEGERPERPDGREPGSPTTRLSSREEAERIVAEVAERPGVIIRAEGKKTRERPPLLFDLTNLQKAANGRFGMSAQRTLSAAQALYERHKAITYPRTDSRHLSSDLAGELPGVLQALCRPPYRDIAEAALARGVPSGKRMIDDSEVGDHHAIIPTAKSIDPGRLEQDEQRVYELVVRRFIAGFLPDAIFQKSVIETRVAAHRFVSRGRVCLDPGWQVAEPRSRAGSKSSSRRSSQRGPSSAEPTGEPEIRLPAVHVGESVHTRSAESRESATEPPRRYSEARLLAAMEKAGRDLEDDELRRALKDAGLGTPATRAATIETLLKRRYIERRGKVLRPTTSGRALIAAIPVDDLLSAELTGAWEQKLAEVARGRYHRDQFMNETRAFVTRIVEAIAAVDGAELATRLSSELGSEAVEGLGQAEVLGRCPVCKTAVTESFKAYQCATGRECTFVIFKRIAGRGISPALVKVLLGRGQSQVLRGFRSKKGKRFAAALALGDDGKVSMVFDNDRSGRSGSSERGTSGESGTSRRRSRRRTSSSASGGASGGSAKTSGARTPLQGPRCPACREGRIVAGNRGWGCSRWRESCRFVVWFHHGDLRLPDDEADRLFRRGQTRLMEGLSPDGRARLVLDLEREGNVRIELGKRQRRDDPS